MYAVSDLVSGRIRVELLDVMRSGSEALSELIQFIA